MAPTAKYVAKYGDMTLLVASFTDEGDGRDWVVQSPSTGDQHVLQDRGRGVRRTTCEIVFCDEPRAGDYRDRYLAFRQIADSSLRHLFQHPMRGAYEAACAFGSASVDAARRCVTVSCTFIEAGEVQPVTPIGGGSAAAAGPEAVAARAAAATAALSAAGLTSSAPALSVAAVTAWAEQLEPNARAIALEAGGIARAIDDRLSTLVDLAHWPAYRALVTLRYAVVRAAEAVTSETSKVTSLVLDAAEPLLSICARVYSPREAQERARQVAKLNGLRGPGLVPAGTALKLPAVSR
jgi:hypothetical protein